MTREELVEELNKIKGISARIEGNNTEMPCVDIYYNKSLVMSFYYNNYKIISISGVFFKDRTEQQVLSVVKALVE